MFWFYCPIPLVVEELTSPQVFATDEKNYWVIEQPKLEMKLDIFTMKAGVCLNVACQIFKSWGG